MAKTRSFHTLAQTLRHRRDVLEPPFREEPAVPFESPETDDVVESVEQGLGYAPPASPVPEEEK